MHVHLNVNAHMLVKVTVHVNANSNVNKTNCTCQCARTCTCTCEDECQCECYMYLICTCACKGALVSSRNVRCTETSDQPRKTGPPAVSGPHSLHCNAPVVWGEKTLRGVLSQAPCLRFTDLCESRSPEDVEVTAGGLPLNGVHEHGEVARLRQNSLAAKAEALGHVLAVYSPMRWWRQPSSLPQSAHWGAKECSGCLVLAQLRPLCVYNL